METDGTVHRLAAIISGDIVGYSRLIGSDEALAVRLVTAYREEIELLVRQNQGHLVDFTGDNFLAHFSSSLTAVSCAVEIQQVLTARNQSLPDDHKMQFRLGIHQGDVRMEGDRVFGSGVNVAARLEALAEPGGICISGSVRDQLQGRTDLRTENMGTRSVKNISEPIAVHRLIFGHDVASTSVVPAKASPGLPKMLFPAAIFAALLATGIGYWLTREPATAEVAAVTPASIKTSVPASDGAVVPAMRRPGLKDRPSIVVLPFNNMSGDEEQNYFADGISEDLTTDLSKIPQLFVIARNSAFAYKGEHVDIQRVGRELAVRYVLEGSVRKVQGRVRINAQLIDATTGFHLWSERYDRELSDVFAVQNEISEKILSELQVNIEEAELARIRRRPIENLNAYEAWHKGRTLTRDFSRESVAEGRRLLERAIELQPNYGEAYAALGNSYMAEFVGWNFDPALAVKAAEMAERAIELSPLSPLSVTSLAAVEMGRFRPDKAIELAKRAIALAPSSANAFSILGVAQIQLGNLEDGRVNLEEAVRLNPISMDINLTMLGFAQFYTGDPESGVELWERIRAENQEALPDRVFLIQHYQSSGQSDLAQTIVKEILKVNPYYTAEQAVELFRFVGGFPDDMESVVTGNFKLAGLP
jgi:adenylate cyclase